MPVIDIFFSKKLRLVFQIINFQKSIFSFRVKKLFWVLIPSNLSNFFNSFHKEERINFSLYFFSSIVLDFANVIFVDNRIEFDNYRFVAECKPSWRDGITVQTITIWVTWFQILGETCKILACTFIQCKFHVGTSCVFLIGKFMKTRK